MMSLYARRVLAPLTAVTERANAVARGDLTPKQALATNDEIGELATTFEDMVAAIRRARAELVNAERLAAIGKMAAHVTHEIRNPLSSIGLNLELLEEEVARASAADMPDAELRPVMKESAQLVTAIRAEVDRLSRIAEQYLSVARRPRPRLEPERVDDLVHELVAFVRPELDRAGVAVRVEVEEAGPEILLDESQIRQALLNLLRNAREAMPKGGEIVVSVSFSSGAASIAVDEHGPRRAGGAARASIFDPSSRRSSAVPGSGSRSRGTSSRRTAARSRASRARRGARGSGSRCPPGAHRPRAAPRTRCCEPPRPRCAACAAESGTSDAEPQRAGYLGMSRYWRASPMRKKPTTANRIAAST